MNRLSLFGLCVIQFTCSVVVGTFTQHTVTGNTATYNALRLHDIDGDGDLDIAASAHGSNFGAWFENDGSGNFVKHDFHSFSKPSFVVPVDIDGDGDVDLVTSSVDDVGFTVWYENDGTESFIEHKISTSTSRIFCVDVADFDGDGDLDIVSVGDSHVILYVNDGSETFSESILVDDASKIIRVLAKDIDGDGDIDFVFVDKNGNSLWWANNDGLGSFTIIVIDSDATLAREVDVADLDGDGDMDIVLGMTAVEMSWYENDGSEVFTKHVITTSVGEVSRANVIVDLDGDGDLDIVMSAKGLNIVVFYENDGNENFSATTLSDTIVEPAMVVVGDVNGDGRVDVVVSGIDSSSIYWIDTGFAVPTSLPTLSPTAVPTAVPTVVPTFVPTDVPSHAPSVQPTPVPSGTPTMPTSQPSGQPSCGPTDQPSSIPSSEPSSIPSCQPSSAPTDTPSGEPSSIPSCQPSSAPTDTPSGQPSSAPSKLPTAMPSSEPTSQPTSWPSDHPSSMPSVQPSTSPSGQPSGVPSGQPTALPSSAPSGTPSGQPSGIPSDQPSGAPSGEPSSAPSKLPTAMPSSEPTSQPTSWPSDHPSSMPSVQPSTSPSGQPSGVPSGQPTALPSSAPTAPPTIVDAPVVSIFMARPTGATVPLHLSVGMDIKLEGLLSSSKLSCNATFAVVDVATKQVLLSRQLEVVAPVMDYKIGLIVRKHTLSTVTPYSFKLSCLDVYAELKVVTNGPPTSGRFSVSPLFGGVEMQTYYSLGSSNWLDADLPLRYLYSFKSISADGSTLQNVVKSKSEVTSSSCTLPAIGNDYNNNTIVMTSIVYDVYDCSVNVDLVVQVLPMQVIDTAATQALISDQLESSLSAGAGGDKDAVQQVLVTASSVLNKADCSAFGENDCATLYNRENCGAVSNTCGNCLQGYDIGEYGPHNSVCMSVAAASILTVSAEGSEDVSCSASSPCANPFQFCNSTTALCEFKVVSCVNDCSGHGKCLYKNKNNGNILPGNCYEGDVSCKSVCKCDVGYNTKDCSVSDADLENLKQTRELLLNGLSSLTASDSGNGTGSVVSDSAELSSWSNNLASITQSPSELSAAAVQQALGITQVIVQEASSNSDAASSSGSFAVCEGGVMATLNSLISNAADLEPTGSSSSSTRSLNGRKARTLQSGRILVQDATYVQFSDSLAAINSFVAGSLTASALSGESSSSFAVYDNFRKSSVVVIEEDGLGNISGRSKVPVTGLEALSGVLASSASVESNEAGQFNMAVISTPVSVYNSMLVANGINTTSGGYSSNPMSVHVVGSGSDSSIPEFITVTLQHIEEQYVGVVEEGIELPVLNATCVMNVTNATDSVCPNGAVITHSCDGSMNGVVSIRCPDKIIRSQCVLLDADGLPESEGCVMVSETAYNTTCRCSIKSSRRRFLAEGGPDAGFAEVSAMSVSSFEGFVSTFDAAEDLTNAAAFEKVMMVIIMFGVVWGGGFFAVFAMGWYSQHNKMNELRDKVADVYKAKKHQEGLSHMSNEKIKDYILDYIDKVFPPIFASQRGHSSIKSKRPGGTSRMWREIKAHHRYITLFTYSKAGTGVRKRESKYLILFQLLSLQTMLMFVLAVCFDLQGPADDGTCPGFTDESSCIERKSIFDTSSSYCVWENQDVSSGNTPECAYNEVPFTFDILVLSAVVVSLFTAIFNIPLDGAFDLLFAPTADELKVEEKHNGLVRKVGVQMSNAAASVARNVRRASAMVTSAASRALALSSSKEEDIEVKVGSLTRHIPEETKEAYNLAHSGAALGLMATISMSSSLHNERTRDIYYKRTSGGKHSSASLPGGAVDSASPDVSIVTAFKSICQDISLQRQLLKPSELRVFDTQWGIALDENDNQNNFDTEHVDVLDARGSNSSTVLSSVECCVLNEMKVVRETARERVKKLSLATDSHIGLEIMHSFILDILGRDTPAAKIFNSKTEEDFNFTYIVTKQVKIVVLVVMVLVNLFFIYFALLKSLARGIAFQQRYVMACTIQFLVEIFLFQTMECLIVNYWIPSLISEQVAEIAVALKDSMVVLFAVSGATGSAPGRDHKKLSRYRMLDVTKYLFVSTLIAKEHPKLLESYVVSSYHNYLPGEIAKKWHNANIHSVSNYYYETLMNYHVSARNGSLWTGIKLGLFNMVMSLALYVGALPMSFQKPLIHTIQPILLAALTASVFIIATNLVASVSALAVLLVAVFAVVYNCCFDGEGEKNVRNGPSLNSKVTPQLSGNDADDEFIVLDDIDDGSSSSSSSSRNSISVSSSSGRNSISVSSSSGRNSISVSSSGGVGDSKSSGYDISSGSGSCRLMKSISDMSKASGSRDSHSVVLNDSSSVGNAQLNKAADESLLVESVWESSVDVPVADNSECSSEVNVSLDADIDCFLNAQGSELEIEPQLQPVQETPKHVVEDSACSILSNCDIDSLKSSSFSDFVELSISLHSEDYELST